MGRPKKSELGPVPTKEKILQKALELFATRGYDAVSVRDITNPLELNQATLYIYYKNKAALLDAIFKRLEERLIEPGFVVPPVKYFSAMESFNLATFLIEGAKQFFGRSDRETLLTWRLLLMSQYGHKSARDCVESQILDAPANHFGALLQNIKDAGLLREEIDPVSTGRIIAAMFFEYSFRANLEAAWEGEREDGFEKLCDDIRTLATTLEY